MPEHETIRMPGCPRRNRKRRRTRCILIEPPPAVEFPIGEMLIATRRRRKPGRRREVCTLLEPPLLARFAGDARGLYRVFPHAYYLFYRSDSGPPAESDSHFALASFLGYSPPDTFADGTWYLSVCYYNGVIKSGFLPLDPMGRTWRRLEIASGEEKANPSADPSASVLTSPGIWQLEVIAGGVIRVHGYYNEQGSIRADDWCIAYTTDGTNPTVPPTAGGTTTIVYNAIGGTSLAVLEYELPAQSHGTEVRVRINVRRDIGGGSYVYSEGSDVVSADADAVGPTTPLGVGRWPGPAPQEL